MIHLIHTFRPIDKDTEESSQDDDLGVSVVSDILGIEEGRIRGDGEVFFLVPDANIDR